MLTIVYDLRWLRTRSKLGSAYRGWDLKRTVHRSEALLCISENTLRDLIEFAPQARGKATSCLLGPGHIPKESFRDSDSGLLMLVGGAPHKRNELAAAVLAMARPSWVTGIVGVGVSEEVKRTLSPVFSCQWFQGISDAEMLALYQQAQYFLMLGTDEGFGLPFVEALATGCQVIATDHDLAREVLGSAGHLLEHGEPAVLARQLVAPPNIPRHVRIDHTQAFSWSAFGRLCESELVRVASH